MSGVRVRARERHPSAAEISKPARFLPQFARSLVRVKCHHVPAMSQILLFRLPLIRRFEIVVRHGGDSHLCGYRHGVAYTVTCWRREVAGRTSGC